MPIFDKKITLVGAIFLVLLSIDARSDSITGSFVCNRDLLVGFEVNRGSGRVKSIISRASAVFYAEIQSASEEFKAYRCIVPRINKSKSLSREQCDLDLIDQIVIIKGSRFSRPRNMMRRRRSWPS